MLRELLENMKEWDARIFRLKQMSQRWPEVASEEYDDGTVALTTLVRIFRDGQWYLVHCVEMLNEKVLGYSEGMLYQRLISSVYNIQVLHQVTGTPWEELDEFQMSEEERLKK